VQRLVQTLEIGAQARAERSLAARGLALVEVLAQLVGRGDDHLGELIERRGARLDRAVAGEPQVADRLDNAVGALWDHRGVPGQRLACRHLGVDRIALATPPARMRVRPVDFDRLDPARAQIANQSGRVGAGGLDADDVDAAEGLKPGQ